MQKIEKALCACLLLSAIGACRQHPAEPSGSDLPGSSGGRDSLFSEDFESGTLAAWQDGRDPSRQRIVTDSGLAQSGERFLAVTYPAGRDGGWLTRFLTPGFESLYVSLHVRFPENWQGPTKLLALYGSRTDDEWSAFGKAGTCPNGSDFFATMLVTEPGGNPGPTRFYTYYPGMAREPDGTTCWGRYGDSSGSAVYGSSLTLSRDAWHHLEFWVQLNAPGRADGRQTFWIDGAPRGTWFGLSLRDEAILRLNAVQLSFNAGASGAAQTQELFVDNVVVRSAP